LSISGFSFVGTDIGGFVNEPAGELMVRWLQLAIFHPVMRVHSMGNNADGAAEAEANEVKKAEELNRQDQEPWVYGEPFTTDARKAIEQRYRLLPYLYTAFRQHLLTGKPLLRNLFFEDQADPMCRKFGDQFFCGDNILVAPVVKEKVKTVTLYLPKGDWYDFYKGKHYVGGKKYKVTTKTDRIPMFVRAGAIIPTVQPVQHTGEFANVKELELSVYLGTKKGKGQLYWDAGEGYGYEEGDFIEANFHFKSSAKKTTIYQKTNGNFEPSFRQIRLFIVGKKKAPKTVRVDGRKVNVNKTKRGLEIVVPFSFKVVEF
jgi:alpha-glucosidase